jgi:hypothetical protein
MLQKEEKSSIAKHNVKTILNVEDDTDNLELYTEVVALLKPRHITVARNVSQALRFVQHIKPSFFLLELELT